MNCKIIYYGLCDYDYTKFVFKENITDLNCNICSTTEIIFGILPCCKQIICDMCIIKWFNSSTVCPYCRSDISLINLKKCD